MAEEDTHLLVEMAQLVAKATVLMGDLEAQRELKEFLGSFAKRHKDKIDQMLIARLN